MSDLSRKYNDCARAIYGELIWKPIVVQNRDKGWPPGHGLMVDIILPHHLETIMQNGNNAEAKQAFADIARECTGLSHEDTTPAQVETIVDRFYPNRDRDPGAPVIEVPMFG